MPALLNNGTTKYRLSLGQEQTETGETDPNGTECGDPSRKSLQK